MRILVVTLLLLFSGMLQAVEEIELLHSEDDVRFHELSNVLRCMVCQNQSIADSNADLARDFRNQVKEKINAGQSNQEIIDYMVERYGDYILYKPPFNTATALLWTGPFLLAIVGFFMIVRLLRRQDDPPSDDPADDAVRRARLKSMLDDDEDKS